MFDALNPSNDLAEAQAASPTAHLLDELALFGHRPYQDDPDPRPLPEPDEARRAMIGIFSTAQDLLCDTRLEDDLPEILWGFVNTFHRKLDWIELELDHNEVAQRRSQGEQDGSEVRSVELERLIDQGKTLVERRNSFEFCAMKPRAYSRSHRLGLAPPGRVDGQSPRADRRDDRQPRFPRRPPQERDPASQGTRIAFTGGSNATITSASGTRSTRCATAIPTWSCSMADPERRGTHRRLLGG